MKILQGIQNEVVVNFNDVIRIACCALNIESTQPVNILTIEWILWVTKSRNTMQFYFVVLKIPGLKDQIQILLKFYNTKTGQWYGVDHI